jgi:hypothetical protein
MGTESTRRKTPKTGLMIAIMIARMRARANAAVGKGASASAGATMSARQPTLAQIIGEVSE